ncbi:hypothetical protein UVI_02001900 [Ustilaginoidea virens]|uniref:Uncharacterized protein n=1 Tax=Ustilaginoidea virens TaxID=1159556 RepID=A0A1B5L8T9_USTVR|nr:hypothetical protein UVI_02001900 [Ustilaginoidea virens]
MLYIVLGLTRDIILGDRYIICRRTSYLRFRDSSSLAAVDIYTAFYKIYIAKGDKHLTIFRTRFSLFKWLVTPFRDLLGDFTTAYLDNILVYTDLDKYNFIIKEVYYFSYIIIVGKEIRLDPKKIKAI